jgi:BirA family biotin operon repressor/biotin-[acetyl-CoA-carboxylase] ligase
MDKAERGWDDGGDSLEPAAVAAALVSRWLGRHYEHVAEIGSTNERLRRWLQERSAAELPDGAVLAADYQSQGRGRLGRRWLAPAGTALLFSTVLRPGWPAERGPWLSMIAGLAAAEAIAGQTGLAVALKWPNDIVIGGNGDDPLRKLGGILLEGVVVEERLAAAVVGVGLNVNIPAAGLPDTPLPATSLLLELGRPVPRRPLLVALLARLEAYYEAAIAGQSPQPAWNALLVTNGRPVLVSREQSPGGPPLAGVAEGTDEWGNLVVRDEAGQRHVVSAGDVSLRPG